MRTASHQRLKWVMPLVALVFLLLTQAAAHALPLVGLTDDNRLALFESERPGTIIAARKITGLQPGENILGIDLRPANNQLYGVGGTSRLYRINMQTGAATQVGVGTFSPSLGVSPSTNGSIGVDFDPVQDVLRVVVGRQNLRVNPNTGAVIGVDAPTFMAGEQDFSIGDIAYDNNGRFAASTTLYAIDFVLDRLLRVGSPRGTPVSPNSGEVFPVGRLGGPPPPVGLVGFDVVPGNSSTLAFASLTGADAAATRLFAVNLQTGRAFVIGHIGTSGSLPGLFLRGLAALPIESDIYAVTATNKLLLFNAFAPEAIIQTRLITGLREGESIVGMDFRRPDGRLYALGSTSRLYRINVESGAATPVNENSFAPALNGTDFGVSIHPLRDVMTVTSDTRQNLELHPASGTLIENNPPLAYAAGDPNEGKTPRVVALAHMPNTTPDSGFSFFTMGIDTAQGTLVSMSFPNTGQLRTVGPLDVFVTGNPVSFDADLNGTLAYVAMVPLCFEGCPTPSSLFSIDLNAGRLTFVGGIGGGEMIRAIAMSHPQSIQFAKVSHSIVENCGVSAELVVTRTGFADGPASVDFVSGNNPAMAAPAADERSDYTAALGTLRFAAGESVKAIKVLITDDAFVEGDTLLTSIEVLNVTLSNPTGGYGLGAPSVATLAIEDDDVGPGADLRNPMNDTALFVCQHYHDFLNREPDAAGLAFWTNNIESCGADAQCRDIKRRDTSAAFFLSTEFQETGFFIQRVYKAGFGREPVPLDIGEFQRDMQRVAEGVVIGEEGALERLEANKRAYVEEFVQRQDFLAGFVPSPFSAAQYVDTLNARTGGALSQAERDALVEAFQNGRETRATVFRRIVEDADFKRSEFNRAFVLMQYFGYLRRNPQDAPDNSLAGYNFWLGKLNEHGGDFRRAEMVKSFILSGEYRRRFTPR